MLEKEKIKETTKEVVEHFKSDEVKLKLVSFCCVVIIIMIIIISGQLFYLYKSLNSLIDLVEDGEYNRVSEVFYNEKKPEDILPILEVTSTTETTSEVEESINIEQDGENSTTEATSNNSKQNDSTSTTNKQETPNKHETTTKNNNSTTTATNSTNTQTKTYVINKSTKKIHTDNCSFVERMKEDNKQTVKLSDDELDEYINNGYTLCSSCGG